MKFNGSLWISRKLSPNGRSISLRVSGGYNNSNTDAFNYSETDFYQDPARNDSILDQMIKQKKQRI
ncbi:MAG: hypothetical protein ACLVKO_06215 [Dysgonomonas sp.]